MKSGETVGTTYYCRTTPGDLQEVLWYEEQVSHFLHEPRNLDLID